MRLISFFIFLCQKYSLLSFGNHFLIKKKLYLFPMAEILNSPKGSWFCKTVMKVWTCAPSLAPPVGLNKVQTKCSSISGSESNKAAMCRAWNQNQKITLLKYIDHFCHTHIEKVTKHLWQQNNMLLKTQVLVLILIPIMFQITIEIFNTMIYFTEVSKK
jgi:hypothetical protein